MNKSITKLFIFLMACLIAMPLVFALAAGTTPNRQIVYIADNGTGDGSSAANALGNGSGYAAGGSEAYKQSALYLAFNKLVGTGGKIVICDTITINAGHTGSVPANSASDMKLPSLLEQHQVTITSVDPADDTDYRVTKSAKIVIDRASCPVNIISDANLLIENITFATIVDSTSAYDYCRSGPVIAANCKPMTLGDGILCTAVDNSSGKVLQPTVDNRKAFPTVVGSNRFSNKTGDTNLTIRSGTYNYVRGADYGIGLEGYGVLTGNVNLNIVGGTFFGEITGSSLGSQSIVTGKININISGGTFYSTVCGCGPKGYGEASSLYINVSGGDFSKLSPGSLSFTTNTSALTKATPPANSVISFQDYPAADYNRKILNGVTQDDSTTRAIFYTAAESSRYGFKTVYAPNEERVIFVKDGGTGDGSSASSPLKVTTGIAAPAGANNPEGRLSTHMESPLYQAFHELKDTGGTIVICGQINLDANIVNEVASTHSNYDLPVHGSNKITVTSVWNGVDYRVSNNASLILERPTQLVLGGETEWNNVTLLTKGTSRMIVCSGFKTLFGEGITSAPYDSANASSKDHYLSIIGGERYLLSEYDTDLTVLSGTYNNICGGSFNSNAFNSDRDLPRGSLMGDTHLTVGGTTVVKGYIYGTTPNTSTYDATKVAWHKGNVYITIDGSVTVNAVYGAGSGRFLNEGAEVHIKVKDIGSLGCAFFPADPNSPLNNAPAKAILDLSDFNPSKSPDRLFNQSRFTDILPPTGLVKTITLTKAPDKTSYFAGDKLDLTGAKLTFLMSTSAQHEITLTCDPAYSDNFSIPSLTAGMTNAIVWYGSKAFGIPVTVVDRPSLTTLGAQIKTDNSIAQGLRFIASMQMNHTITPTAYGFYVIPSEALNYAEELRPDRIGGAYKLDATGTYLRQELNNAEYNALYNTSSTRVFAATYNEIPVEHFNSKFTAIAYMTFTYNGAQHTIYSDPIERSVYQVAKGAYLSTKEDLTDRDWLKLNIVDRVESGAVNPVSESRSAATRREVAEYMWYTANVKWTPSVRINYEGRLSYGTPAYEVGKTYHGLPYNSSNGNGDAFKALLQNDTLPSNIDTDWYHLPGSTCSTSILMPYHYAFNQLTREVGAANMIPVFNIGFDQVGSYGQPKYITSTAEIFKAGGSTDDERFQTMYEAYALMQPGDSIISRWNIASGEYLAHSRMIVTYPKIVRNSDGTINGEQSTVQALEQGSTITQNHRGVENTTWLHHTWNFHQLALGNSYVPITVEDMRTGFSDPAWSTIRAFNTSSDVTSGVRGMIRSNYQIKFVQVKFLNASGSTIKNVSLYPAYSKFCFLEDYSQIDTAVSALASGSYTMVISANVNNENVELTRIPFTK